MPVTVCSDCGFLCEEYQLKKTNGECPVCNKKEARDFLNRVKAKKEAI